MSYDYPHNLLINGFEWILEVKKLLYRQVLLSRSVYSKLIARTSAVKSEIHLFFPDTLVTNFTYANSLWNLMN